MGNPRACYEPVPGPMLDPIARQPRDGTTVVRYTQSAHESLFNRRLRVLSLAARTNESAQSAAAD